MTLDDFVHAYDFMFGYTFFLVMNYVSLVLHDLLLSTMYIPLLCILNNGFDYESNKQSI